jgi:protein phosphatase
MRLDIGASTDVGLVRETNEDSYRLAPDLNLFVLSDGIGGQAHGEIASELAVDTIIAQYREPCDDTSSSVAAASPPNLSSTANKLVNAIHAANLAIFRAAASDFFLRGMGATIVAAWIQSSRLTFAHVGDSRIYLLHSGSLERLTRDHSLVAEQVRMGLLTDEEAEGSRLQTVLTRALGVEDTVDIDVAEQCLAAGDTILMCSDGLSRLVSDEKIAQTLQNSPDAQTSADRLVALAKYAGGTDNITVIVLRV